ncbi:MAG TPA: hypothetical protein VMI92_00980 [Steroidobacteraceae bacterium]|nr:hypothetical protein [Steroidobacteraceae bacterium]
MKRISASSRVALLAGAWLSALFACAAVFAQAPAGSVAQAASAVTAPAGNDIRDIRGPLAVPSWWPWVAWLGGAALAAAAGYGAWRWRRARPQASVLPPHDIALRRLEAIRSLMRPEAARDFSIAASDIVRAYVEQRFRIMAAHRTTEEFLHDLLLPSGVSLAAHRGALAAFLHHCDLAKFGGCALSGPNMEAMYESARAFVLATAAPAQDPRPADAVANHAHLPRQLGKDDYGSLPST